MKEALSFTHNGLENHSLSALVVALHHSLKLLTSLLPLQARRFQFEDKATQTLVNLLEYAAQTKPGLKNGASKPTRTTNPSVLNLNRTQTLRAPHPTAFRSSLDLLRNTPQLHVGSAARPGTGGSNRPETCPQATAVSTWDFYRAFWPTQLLKSSNASTDRALPRF